MNSNTKKLLKSLMIYAAFTLIMLVLMSMKAGYHVDELLTMELSNSDTGFMPEKGVRYTPADAPYVSQLSSDGHVNLRNVWHQQANDVHPPFYYAIVNIVFSFFAGSVSMRYLGLINIVFELITLYFVRKLLEVLLDQDDFDKDVLSWGFILCAGILSMTAFFRMYVMAICAITAFSYILVRDLGKMEIVKTFVPLYICTLWGALTHYYFLIFAFFMSCTVCIFLIYNKRIREVVCYCVTMAIAGVTSILIFPAMIKGLFFSNRGEEAVGNILNSEFGEKFLTIFDIISNDLFGGGLLIFVIAIIALIVVDFYRADHGIEVLIQMEKLEKARYVCMILPVMLYVIFIAKIVPYLDRRYVSLVYTVAFSAVWSLVFRLLKGLFVRRDNLKKAIVTIIAIFTLSGLLVQNWQYLELGYKPIFEFMEEYCNNADAICCYESDWRMQSAYLGVAKCNSSVFYKKANYDEFAESFDESFLSDRIALFVEVEDVQGFIDGFMEDHPEYHIDNEFGFAYTYSYYLSRN